MLYQASLEAEATMFQSLINRKSFVGPPVRYLDGVTWLLWIGQITPAVERGFFLYFYGILIWGKNEHWFERMINKKNIETFMASAQANKQKL